MNQFKKAKQLRNETGQVTESITDLKTAGVTQKSENIETSTVKEKTISQNISNIDVAIEAKNNESEASTQLPINTISTNPILVDSSETFINNQPIIQPTLEEVQIPASSHKNMTINVTPASPQGLVNTNIPQTINTQIVNETIPSIYTDSIEYENKTTQSVIVQSRNELQSTQEIEAVKDNKSIKKSVPNIFAPKGEAKSMRKSLVLKPTSVKIAEDYCEKNGGSFNELIQTLLDNFIDEYGL